MRKINPLWMMLSFLAATALACQVVSGQPLVSSTPTSPPTATSTPAPTPTPLPPIPVEPGAANPDEPVFITGSIPYTSPFFVQTLSEPFVMLEDEAGFVRRDRNFEFRLNEQVIGPVIVHEDKTLTYSLALPAIPQGTFVDIDNNGKSDKGVQVFVVAYWSNTWDGPFVDPRDGKGWSNAYSSAITDPENEDEIKGGMLVVWAPDEEQGFPTAFGADGKLFTADDPSGPIPAGYNLVDLDQNPFRVYKTARPQITLNEGDVAVNDYSNLSYVEAFDALYKKVSREYPFTQLKGIDWQALYDQIAPQVASAKDDLDFYRALHTFASKIPDAHVGLSINPEVFYQDDGGSFGLVLAQLSDGRVIVTQVIPDSPGDKAGIQVGAEIQKWDGQPVEQAIDQVVPFFGPSSTQQAQHLQQLIFLTRVPPGKRVNITFQNPGKSPQEKSLVAEVEYDSLFRAIPSFGEDKLGLPIEGRVLDSGLGYMRINTFLDDLSLMAKLWDHYMKALIDNKVPGLILDVRDNSGGSGELARDFAGYFFDHEVELYRSGYYSEKEDKFIFEKDIEKIEPASMYFAGPVAVLVSPDCISACEGFSYAMSLEGRATIVGSYPTAGAFGEVGRGQYKLPGDISMQFPTGRSETADGKIVLEGVGVAPEISVPVTEDSATGKVDAVLEAAVQDLLKKVK